MNKEQWIEFFDKEIMTKQDIRKYIGGSEPGSEWSSRSYQQSVDTGQIKPIYVRGEGRGMIRFFLRSDIEEYKKKVDVRRDRLK